MKDRAHFTKGFGVSGPAYDYSPDKKGWKVTIAAALLSAALLNLPTPPTAITPVSNVLSIARETFPVGPAVDRGINGHGAVLTESGAPKGDASAPVYNPIPRGSGKAHPPLLKRTLSVYGNGDGYMGRRTADGTKYRPGSVWFASNEFALGTLVTVTTPEGRSVTAPVKDRMAKRFSHTRIDATVGAWKRLTTRGYGLIRGVRVSKAK